MEASGGLNNQLEEPVSAESDCCEMGDGAGETRIDGGSNDAATFCTSGQSAAAVAAWTLCGWFGA